jgi:hypothetical protein
MNARELPRPTADDCKTTFNRYGIDSTIHTETTVDLCAVIRALERQILDVMFQMGKHIEKNMLISVHIGEIGKAPDKKCYVFLNRDKATKFLIERGFEMVDRDIAINKDFLEHAKVVSAKNNINQ